MNASIRAAAQTPTTPAPMPGHLADLLQSEDPAGTLRAMRAETHPEPVEKTPTPPRKIAQETYTALLKQADPITGLCAQLMVKRGEWIICG